MTPEGAVCVASHTKPDARFLAFPRQSTRSMADAWAEWSVQLLPTKPEDFAPEHMPNLSFGQIPEPIARLEKLASSFFERKP